MPRVVSAKSRLICGILLGLQIGGLGQDAPVTAGKTPDFSEGFKRLAALGLPPLDGKSVWVTSRNAPNSYQFERSLKGFRGNAWQSGTGKEAVFVGFGGLEVSTGTATAAKPDLEKDVATLIEALRKADPQGTNSDGILGYRYSPGGLSMEVLVFATQLHQTGHTDAANRVATALFDAMPSRENLVDKVVGRIASKAYDGVAGEFFATGDWAAYHRDTAALVEKFPRGWNERDSVAMLLPLLENRAKGAAIPPVALPGIGIPDKAAAIVAGLPAKPAPAKAGPGGIDPAILRDLPREHRAMVLRQMYGRESPVPDQWLIGEIPPTEGVSAPLMKLAALGMDALPALAAVLGDTTLTHQRSLYDGHDDGLFMLRSGSGEDSVSAAFLSLNRPASRGEIARKMLQSALPDPDDSLDETDDEMLKTMAIEFWRTHRDHSREELAVVFLRGGSSRQTSLAATILASAKDEKYHKLFEEHILALDPAYPAYDDVSTYLKSRRKAAKGFFESYARLIRSQAPDPKDADDDSGGFDQDTYALRQAGGVEKIIRSLAPLVEDKTPLDIALEIARGKPADAKAAIEGLVPLLGETKPLKRLHALLAGASAATDTTVRARFLHACLEIEWYDGDQEEEEPADAGGEQPKPVRLRKIGPVEAGVWRKLIADGAEIPKGVLASGRNSIDSLLPLLDYDTIGDFACYALESSMETDHGIHGITQAAELLGKKPSELVREFAVARLDGKAPPALPDPEKVGEDRLREIVAAAGALKPTEITAHIKTLTPDEQAKWKQWIADPDDIGIPASVKAMAWVVVGARENPGVVPWPAKIRNSFEAGFFVSPESLLARFKDCAAKPGECSPGVGAFFLAGDGRGLTATDARLDLTSKQPEKTTADGKDGEDGDEDERGPSDPAQLIVGWRETFGVCARTLDAESSAVMAIALKAFRNDGTTIEAVIQMDKDGNATATKGDNDEIPGPDALAAIRTVLTPDDPPSRVTWCVLAREHLDALMKDPAPETSVPSETPPPP